MKTTKYKVYIIICSDRSSKNPALDKTGQVAEKCLKDIGFEICGRVIIPDEKETLKKKILEAVEKFSPELLITSGGTGLGRRDIAPQATKEIIEIEVPGISEYLRIEGAKKTVNAILSRQLAGIYKQTLIINLPGSPKAVQESIEILNGVIFHAIKMINLEQTDCAGTYT